MGLHSLFTGSKTTRLMVAALFGSCLNLHAAEPPTAAATTNAAATSAPFRHH